MDPKKLGALVEEHSKNPLGDLPMAEADDETTEEESGDILARGEELLTSMGEFGEELKESADIIVENAMDIGEDLASEEPAEETEDAAADFADGMPGFMQEGFSENIAGKERLELDAIGAALDNAVESDTPAGEHSDEMVAKVGGFLDMVGNCCNEEADEDEEVDEEVDEENPEAELAANELEDDL